MKKMIVVLVFVAAIAAVLFFGLRAGEEGVAVASATATLAPVVSATTEPVATATPESVALATPVDLVEVATGENPETAKVAVATPTPASTPVATPVATSVATPAPVVSATTEPVAVWYEELIEESASNLFATVVAKAERGGKTAVFCWALTQEELAEMPVDSWVELTQFTTNWDEFHLPQNSQGILALLREMDPLAAYKAAAGSKAPVSSVSEDGFLVVWRDAVSVDTAAVKAANHIENRPVVVALREPDDVGRRYFLVVAGAPAKGYRVEKPAAPVPAPVLVAPGGSNDEIPPAGGTGHSNVVITTPAGGTGHSNVTVTAPSGGTGHSNVTVTTPSGGGTGHSDVAAPAGSSAGGDWVVATGSGRAKAE